MCWNFAARTRGEISGAYGSWLKHDERFGRVNSSLVRIEVAPPPPWFTRH